jgi:hypothetical protein
MIITAINMPEVSNGYLFFCDIDDETPAMTSKKQEKKA